MHNKHNISVRVPEKKWLELYLYLLLIVTFFTSAYFHMFYVWVVFVNIFSSAYEPPTALPLFCPSCFYAFSFCMHGVAVSYIWMGCMPAGLSLRWQHGYFVICPWTLHPLWCPSSPQPFLPSAPQDIYELKDQIQDVEGRYMQGLKELKVEGLELTACLLLSSGSRMVSLTPLPPRSSVPPSVDPNTTAMSLRAPSPRLHNDPFFCMIFPHFLFWS